MTDEMKQQARADFNSMLDNLKMSDGNLNYRKCFNYNDCKAVVLLTPEAYRKTVALLTAFSDEIGGKAWVH